MSERITGRRSPLALCAGLIGLTLLVGCSGAGHTSRRAEIDSAVALFVSGHHQQAIARLEVLAQNLQSEENLREVYYYLGRAHLELGQHDRAIDAFSAGVSYGDNGACVEYLERLRALVEGDEGSIRRSETISRRQLASLLARHFMREDPAVPGDPDDVLRRVVGRGWMTPLPDGSLHGEATVTRAAFYVVLSRLTSQLGYGRTLLGSYAGTLATRGTEAVSGAEVVAALDDLAALVNDYGG
jgi:hypothetical protein